MFPLVLLSLLAFVWGGGVIGFFNEVIGNDGHVAKARLLPKDWLYFVTGIPKGNIDMFQNPSVHNIEMSGLATVPHHMP